MKLWWLLTEALDYWRHRTVPAERSHILTRLRRVV